MRRHGRFLYQPVLPLKSGTQYTYEVLVLAAGQEICVHDFSLTT